jgi:hypothetical protein
MRRSRCWRNLRYSASSIYPQQQPNHGLAKKKITKKKRLLTMTSATLAQPGRVKVLSSPLIAVTSSTREHCRIRRATPGRRLRDLRASNRCSPIGYSSPSCSTVYGEWYSNPAYGPGPSNSTIWGSAPVSVPNDGDRQHRVGNYAAQAQQMHRHRCLTGRGYQRHEGCAEANRVDEGH